MVEEEVEAAEVVVEEDLLDEAGVAEEEEMAVAEVDAPSNRHYTYAVNTMIGVYTEWWVHTFCRKTRMA